MPHAKREEPRETISHEGVKAAQRIFKSITDPSGVLPWTKEVFTELVERVRRERRATEAPLAGLSETSDAIIDAVYTRACGSATCNNCLSHHKWVYGSRLGTEGEPELVHAAPSGCEANTVAAWLARTGYCVRVLDKPRDDESVVRALSRIPPSPRTYGDFFNVSSGERNRLIEEAVSARMNEENTPPHMFGDFSSSP